MYATSYRICEILIYLFWANQQEKYMRKGQNLEGPSPGKKIHKGNLKEKKIYLRFFSSANWFDSILTCHDMSPNVLMLN